MVCGPFIYPLDLQCLFVNVLFGGWTLFILFSLIATFLMAAKFRMSNIVLGGAIMLFSIMFGGYAYWLYAIAGLMFGLIVGYIISNSIKR